MGIDMGAKCVCGLWPFAIVERAGRTVARYCPQCLRKALPGDRVTVHLPPGPPQVMIVGRR